MGAQHSTSRLNRLSPAGPMPGPPKRHRRRGALLQNSNNRHESLDPHHLLHLALSRSEAGSSQSPRTPRAKKLKHSLERTDELPPSLLDLNCMNLETLPSLEALLPVSRLPKAEQTRAQQQSSMQLGDASLQVEQDRQQGTSIADMHMPMPLEVEHGQEEGTQLADLPPEVLCGILARVPRSSWPAARAVCHSWRDAVCAPEALWQRREAGKEERWAVLVEWVPGSSKDTKGILWAFDPLQERGLYRLGWVPDMPGINSTSQMVAIGQYVFFLGGTVSVEKPDGTTEIVPGTAAWSYHLQTGRLCKMPDMLHGRIHFATAVLDGKIIVAGGTGEGDEALTSVEEFDPSTGMWTELPSLHTPRGKCYGGELNGRFCVFSQNALQGPEKYCEVYDPISRAWAVDRKLRPENSSGKSASRFAVVGNKVVLTSDLGRNHGCGSLENHRSSLSLGNQLSWCTSVV